MTDFINEVEEELRRDKYNDLLKKFGPWIILICLAIIVGVGIHEYRKAQKERVSESASISFMEASDAMDAGDMDKASSLFKRLSDVGPGGYPGLSLMMAAETAVRDGNTAEAIVLLDQAAERFERPVHIDMAELKAGYLLADTSSYTALKVRIEPLTAEDRPYTYLAKELLGSAALRSGNLDEAISILGDVDVDPGTPATIQQRVSRLLAVAEARKVSGETAVDLQDEAPSETEETQD